MFGDVVQLKVLMCPCGCGERIEHRGDCLLLVRDAERTEVNKLYEFKHGLRINHPVTGFSVDVGWMDKVQEWQDELERTRTCPICGWLVRVWSPDFEIWHVGCFHDGCRALQYKAQARTAREAYDVFCNLIALQCVMGASGLHVLDGSLWIKSVSKTTRVWDTNNYLLGLDAASGNAVCIGQLPEDYELNPNDDYLGLTEMLEFAVVDGLGEMLIAYGVDYTRPPSNFNDAEVQAQAKWMASWHDEVSAEEQIEREAEAEGPQLLTLDDLAEIDAKEEADFLQELVDAGEVEVEDRDARLDPEVIEDMSRADQAEDVNPADGFPW